MNLLFALAVGVIFGTGLYQLLQRNLLRLAMGLILISNAVNLFLLGTGRQDGDVPAYATIAGSRSDALPQALILTAIVISLGGLLFVLALTHGLFQRQRSLDSDDIRGLKF